MKFNRRKFIKCVTDNGLVFVVFIGVFTLTFYANVIFVDFSDTGREVENTIKRRNGKNLDLTFLKVTKHKYE